MIKKTVLTTVIFLTFFSGSPQEMNTTKYPFSIPAEQELIMKLKELDNAIDSAKRLLDEKGI